MSSGDVVVATSTAPSPASFTTSPASPSSREAPLSFLVACAALILVREGAGVTGEGAEDDAALASPALTMLPCPSRNVSLLHGFLGGEECSPACEADVSIISRASPTWRPSREPDSPAAPSRLCGIASDDDASITALLSVANRKRSSRESQFLFY